MSVFRENRREYNIIYLFLCFDSMCVFLALLKCPFLHGKVYRSLQILYFIFGGPSALHKKQQKRLSEKQVGFFV